MEPGQLSGRSHLIADAGVSTETRVPEFTQLGRDLGFCGPVGDHASVIDPDDTLGVVADQFKIVADHHNGGSPIIACTPRQSCPVVGSSITRISGSAIRLDAIATS